MSRSRRVVPLGAVIVGTLIILIVASVAAERGIDDPALAVGPVQGFPLRFEGTREGGRAPFTADALGGRVALDGAILRWNDARGQTTWSLAFDGAEIATRVEPGQPSSGPTRGSLRAFRSIESRAVYPGIDLSASGFTDRIALHLTIAAGDQPRTPRFRIEGATVRVAFDGILRWTHPAGEFVLFSPSVWQEADGTRTSIPARYEMEADGVIALRIDPADSGLAIVADLEIATTTLHRVSDTAGVVRVAVDAAGAAYVAGDAFVGKLDPTGSDFAWVSYLDGDESDVVESLALDAVGRIAIAGRRGDDAFVAALSADGGTLLWTRTIGGSGSDRARAVGFDAAGHLWIAGSTDSLDFPVSRSAAQSARGGGSDAFVVRLGADGSIGYASYLGGAGDDDATALSASVAGGVAIGGTTRSDGLATSGAAQANRGGGQDAFVATLAADGAIARATYFGGSGDEQLRGLALDRRGRMVVAGSVDGAGRGLATHTLGPLGGQDAFVGVLAPDGTRFEAVTLLGGPGDDDATALAVDHAGHLLIAGRASAGFPTFSDPERATFRGVTDAFVATLDVDGVSPLHAGLIGGAAQDDVSGLAVDGNGKVWLTGTTASVDFAGGKASHTPAEGGDGFVATIADRPGTTAPTGTCPGTRTFDGGPGGTGTAWETAANWSGDTLPIATDDVCIDGAFAVVLGSDSQNAATLRVQNGASLQVDGGALTIAGTSEISGAFTIKGGTLTGAGNITVGGAFDWQGGQMSGSGSMTTQGGMTIGNSGVTLARPLINAPGSTAVSSAGGNILFQTGGSITNQIGATFNVQNDAAWSDPGTSTITNAGTWLRTTSSGTFVSDVPITNTGTFEVRSGNAQVRDYVQNAGITRLNGGAMIAGSGSIITIAGGVLDGNGTIDGTVSIGNGPGTVAPGLSAGNIVVSGSTVFGPSGTYACEIGGVTGTQYDLIGGPTAGSFHADGTLSVSLINGFTPATGDSFTIAQASNRTGTFATTNLPPLSGGNVWNVTYTATTVLLSVAPPTNADLSVTNTDAPDPLNAGANVTYTVTVTNHGPDPATNVNLSDPLPASTSFVSATPSQGTCAHVAGTVSCPLGDIANGASATITIVAMSGAASVPSISNTASAVATETDLTPGNDSATATTTVNAVADLQIASSDTPDPIAAGGALAYTINVSNTGPSVATNLILTDVLPAGVALISAVGTGWTCGNIAETVTCTRPSLAVGAAPAITIDVTAPGAPGSLSNTATVTATENDPTTPNSSTATTNVTGVSDLSITKGDAPDPVNAGATLTYTLNVSNAGPSAASSVSVIDTLPAGAGFVSATGTGWTCDDTAGVVTCTRTTLAVAAAPSITITVTAPAAGGSITNNASATAAEFDPTTPNTASAGTTVTPIADLSIATTDGPDPANVNAPLTYTVTVTNLGPSAADDLTVTDTLPAGVAFVSATGTGWTCGEAAGIVTCTRPTLAAGAAPAITINVTTPDAPGVITNAATVAASSPADPAPANNTATAGTSVAVVTADVSIVKGDAPDPVVAGASLTWTLTVSNAGPDPATNVTVTDILPLGVTLVSATGTGWTCNNASGTVTCTRANLAVAAAPAITITVSVGVAVPGGTVISNTATVLAAEPDNNGANGTATATTTVVASANLSLLKGDGQDPVAAGATLAYILAVSNAGPSNANNLTVTDTLPAGVAFVSATGTGWTCGFASGTLTCTRASLAVGAAPAITLHVTAPPAGPVNNTASVTSDSNDPATSNNSDWEITTVTPVNDLAIANAASAASVAVGGNFSYTLTVSNAGPSPSGAITVTDTLPAGVVYQSASGADWTCSHVSGTVTCTRSNAAVGAAPAITINVSAPATPGTPINTATVATANDPVAGNNSASATVTVVPAADLRLTKTSTTTQISDGGTMTYTISVRNLGPSTATNVAVTDPLPSEATLVSATGPGWTCNLTRGLAGLVCTRASLRVARTSNISIVVTISTGGEGGTVCNTATADSDLADPVPTDNSDQYCVNGVPQGACGSLGDLLTQVEAGPIPTAKRNQWVRYLQTTIEAANLGRQNVVAQRLGFFVKQVRAAEASGVVDSETADSLEACANSLRQQALLRK